jgi:FKBP-type peptidyl-prolyl cis-trans isomerase FklB
MNRLTASAGIAILIFGLAACGPKTIQKDDLDTEVSRISYILGHDIGKNFQERKIEIELDPLFQGIRDGILENVHLFTPDEVQKITAEFQEGVRTRIREDFSSQGEQNLSDGEAFLEANKENAGVVTLDSGLQYVVMREGSGPRPAISDRVKTHYIGTLVDGTPFINTYEAGNPVIFSVNGVIPGWTEALQKMKVGGKWKLFLPSRLAYGESGAGELIGPNAALVFELELLSIEK